MNKSIYFVNPAADFPTYFGGESYRGFGLPAATQMADLSVPTLAAMAPADFDVRVCDESFETVDLETPATYVGITGKITQFGRMVALARAFRDRGKTVLIGGPFASLSPELLRPHCDVLVRGEIEEIAADIFADLASGCWKDEYVGSKPSLEQSPVPRWDLYRNDRAVMGTLQTSRGCPFECEFCDVIQYAGRKQRHKGVAQVLRELDVLYAHGYRTVFLADDNLTVFRARARELVIALREWNGRQVHGNVTFATQVSIDVARDDELLRLCAEAGVTTFFIGIETPNEDSLRETKKRQNLHVNLVDAVHAILARGIYVMGGMIVGFDADGPDIFERQFDFAMQSNVPIFSLGPLVAPAATPLHARLKAAGRLKPEGSEAAAVPWISNIVHPVLGEDELLGGLRWLANSLYSPEALGERLLAFVDKLGPRQDPKRAEGPRRPAHSVELDATRLLLKLRALGPEENKMWERVMRAVMSKPDAGMFVISALLSYMQIRHMYELGQFWDSAPERLAAVRARPAPQAAGRRVLPMVD
jgi:radical SAM superfamily enzyme YgiQ (UPF0313 family)